VFGILAADRAADLQILDIEIHRHRAVDRRALLDVQQFVMSPFIDGGIEDDAEVVVLGQVAVGVGDGILEFTAGHVAVKRSDLERRIVFLRRLSRGSGAACQQGQPEQQLPRAASSSPHLSRKQPLIHVPLSHNSSWNPAAALASPAVDGGAYGGLRRAG
jgi:hypothetical protein